MIQRSAAVLDDLWQGETVLVQGIIDAYFVEDGEIVLVDYKTDRVRRGQEQKLNRSVSCAAGRIMPRRWRG